MASIHHYCEIIVDNPARGVEISSEVLELVGFGPTAADETAHETEEDVKETTEGDLPPPPTQHPEVSDSAGTS